LAFSTGLLCGAQTGIGVSFKEPTKVSTVHKAQMTRLHRLHCHFIRLVGDHGVQAEHFAGLRNPLDEPLPLARSGGELGLALAKQDNATWRLALHKEDCVFGKDHGVFYLVKCIN
jgi:hypothetical protein